MNSTCSAIIQVAVLFTETGNKEEEREGRGWEWGKEGRRLVRQEEDFQFRCVGI